MQGRPFDESVLQTFGGIEVLRTTAERAARRGGELLLDAFAHRDQLVVETKSHNDFVSRADRESEEVIVQTLYDGLGAEHGKVLGEEGGVRGSGDLEWILDPLDGTTNFVEGLPIWCVSVAARWREQLVVGVVYEPLRDTLYSAALGRGGTVATQKETRALRVSDKSADEAFLSTGFPFRAHTVVDEFLGLFRSALLGSRAIRRCGAAALDLAHVAAGIYDGFFEFRLSQWDVAAAGLLIREAGGIVTDLDGGERWLTSGNILAGNPAVHQQLLQWTQEITSQRRIEELVPDR